MLSFECGAWKMDPETYIFSEDEKYLKLFGLFFAARPAAEIMLEVARNFARSQFLSEGIQVSERQFPQVLRAAKTCANVLGIATPEVYIVAEPTLNALTLGSGKKALMVLNSELVDHFTEKELRFVIGHECGHLHARHPVYHVVGEILAFPFPLFLNKWMRYSEITADRAGMLCVKDLKSSLHALIKLALGTKKLYRGISISAYLNQLSELKSGYGKITEIFSSHPSLPKRVEALRFFAGSSVFKKSGVSKHILDGQVRKLMRVLW